MQNCIIRAALPSDLDSILAIDSQASDYSWSEKQHQDCINADYPSLVVQLDGDVVAFAVFTALYDECHLMNIATAPQHQGKGLARQLLHAMEQWALKQNSPKINSLWLEVRQSNHSAIGLYRSENYQLISNRKNYYPKNNQQREDALIMSKSL